MKKIYSLLFIASLIFTLQSCEDLDTYPHGDEVTSKQKEEVLEIYPKMAEAGVNAIFAQFNQYMPNETALGAERHNDFGYPALMLFMDHNGYDLISEDNGYNWNGNNLDFSDRLNTSNEAQIMWNSMYAIINMTNNVIGAIPTDVEDPTSKFYLGQGLAARAFSYWVLVQLYQFNYVGNETAPGVVIITDENAGDAAFEGTPRATVQEVYDLINSDINSAIEYLTVAADENIKRKDKRYIDIAVAYGIRARINLTMQKWSEAAADADMAIQLSDAEPAAITDVDEPSFMSSKNESNWMWGIVVAETDRVVTSGIVNWPSHMGSLNYGYANFSGGKQINKTLYATIPDSDVRKGWWLDEDGQSSNLNDEQMNFVEANSYPPYTQVKFAPYNNVIDNATNANDIPLMRIEEMHYIKAEAQAMINAGTGTQTLVEFVQSFRDPSYSFEGGSSEAVQEEIFRQRRIEFWGEGLNWFDIMRLNKGIDRRGGGYPNATMVFNIPPQSSILLWRIPEAEIQANIALTESDNNPSAPTPDPVADL